MTEAEKASARERQRKWYKEHREEKNEATRKLYQMHKENGLCIACGKKVDRKGVRCSKCAKKHKSGWYYKSQAKGVHK